jgi:hypothetical protein
MNSSAPGPAPKGTIAKLAMLALPLWALAVTILIEIRSPVGIFSQWNGYIQNVLFVLLLFVVPAAGSVPIARSKRLSILGKIIAAAMYLAVSFFIGFISLCSLAHCE